MAEHDLSKQIIGHLDRHLSFPLLQHLAESEIFPAREIQVAQYELAKGTNMFDYAVSFFEKVYPNEPVPSGAKSMVFSWRRLTLIGLTEFDQKRESAVSTHQRLQNEAQAVLDVIENPDVAQALRQDKNQNLQYLKDNYNASAFSFSAIVLTVL
jgi:translation initiation factor 3 subunit E